MNISLDDLDLEPGQPSLPPASGTFEPPPNLDDIRQLVVEDKPLSLDQERALLHSIRRGYSVQVAAKVKATRSASASAGPPPKTRSRKTSAELFSSLGGLDALDKL